MKARHNRALNPAGKIPALETPARRDLRNSRDPALASRKPMPATRRPRGAPRTWRFPEMAVLHRKHPASPICALSFYPQDSVGEDGALQAKPARAMSRSRLCRHYTILDEAAGAGHAFFNGPGPTAARFLHRLVHALVGALRAWRDRLVLAWRLSPTCIGLPCGWRPIAGSAVSCRCRGARSDTVLGAADHAIRRRGSAV